MRLRDKAGRSRRENRGGRTTTMAKSESGCREKRARTPHHPYRHSRRTPHSKVDLLGECSQTGTQLKQLLLGRLLDRKPRFTEHLGKDVSPQPRTRGGRELRAAPSLDAPPPLQREKEPLQLKPEPMPRGSGRQFTAGKTEPLARCGPWAGGGGLHSA